MKNVNKTKTIILIIIFPLFIIVLLLLNTDIGITPLSDYCYGIKVNRNIIHKILPDAKFEIGTFRYDVNEKLLDRTIEGMYQIFNSTSTDPNIISIKSKDYWEIPYCIGHQYYLE